MIALHAIWTRGNRLFFFGEDPEAYRITASSRGRTRKVRPHPFCCDAPLVCDALRALGLKGPAAPVEVTLQLPSRGNPLPSPALCVTPPAGEPDLRPWNVLGAGLETLDAIEMLIDLPQSHKGIMLGDSVTFWSEMAKLALEMTLRCRFLPSLEYGNGSCRARWQPFPDPGDDLSRLRVLMEAMPPLCRSEVLGDAEPPPLTLIDAFLEYSVDALVRQCLSEAGVTGIPKGRKATAPAAWLRVLLGPNPLVEASEEHLAQMASGLRPWLRTMETPPDPLRLCLRLDAPEDSEDLPWRLEFLLQARDDPSLLVPAEAVWRARDTLKYFNRRFHNPQERLLEDLGRAARLYPGIAPTLAAPKPTGADLDIREAYVFLRDHAQLLTQAGYGVLLPQWWKSPSSSLAARLRVTSPGTDSRGSFGFGSLVDFSWELAIGEDAISPEEFLEMAELKTPLIRLRGRWVEMNPQHLEGILRFLAARGPSGRMSVGEVLRLRAGVDATPMPLKEVRAEGWLDHLLHEGNGQVRLLQEPPGFNGTLRPYQIEGVSWLAFLSRFGIGACLADDMGLGKTVQTLALLLHEKAMNDGALRVLLVCPMSVMENWRREAERFSPSLKVHVHHGPDRLRDKEFLETCKSNDLVLTTYSLVLRDAGLLSRLEWNRVILDEAQNIKNPSAGQTQAARALRAHHRIALTGTPVENRLLELWSIMEFLNPGALGTERWFERQFSVPIERYRNEEKETRLKEVIRPFVLRRLKTDRSIIQDLPDKIETTVFCHLTREQASLYQAAVQDAIQNIASSGGIERKGLVLATLMRLKQICNHPAQFLQDASPLTDRSGKMRRLEEMLEEVIETGDRALVFTQFAEMGAMLKAHLEERFSREVLYLHGGTSRRERDELVSRFQGDRGPSLFVLSLKAGGTGLNLTRASQVFHFDRWWNPAVESQATDRAFRIGQKRNVLVHKYVCKGTLEERIDQMLESKKGLSDSILGSGEAWITELSTDDLRRLMVLSREAVEED